MEGGGGGRRLTAGPAGPARRAARPGLFDRVAERVVGRCLDVRQGEVVLVWGGPHQLRLLEGLAVAVLRRGGFPEIKVRSDDLGVRAAREVPPALLRRPPEYWRHWLGEAAALVSVDFRRDPGRSRDLDPEGRGAWEESVAALSHLVMSSGVRWVGLGYPTRERARRHGLNFRRLWATFWGAVEADPGGLAERGRPLRQALEGAQEVRVTCPGGTDLRLGLAGRRPLLESGLAGQEDGTRGTNLPGGEVYLAPDEGSAQGRLCLESLRCEGTRVVGLELEFEAGRIVHSRARRHLGAFLARLGRATGDCDRVGELGLGLNPAVSRPVGYTLLDEKALGTVHLALGENRTFGGRNASSLHWDLVLWGATVAVDGRTVLAGGRPQWG